MFFISLCLMSFLLTMITYKYCLLVLIMFEVLIMSISMVVFFIFGTIGLEIIFIYYLVFSVCESVLGLSILVLIIRYFGGDYYSAFSSMKF